MALGVVVGLRLALSPFAAAVGQPDALWLPRGSGSLFASPPPAGAVFALQLVGVAAAGLYLWRRRLAPLMLAWVCLLLLAGLRTSLGKILHNDVLLLVAAVPLLLAGPVPSEEPQGSFSPDSAQRKEGHGSRRRARPRRWLARSSHAARPTPAEAARTGLDAAAAIVILAYLSAAWWKLLRSGPAWAFSDNLRWSLAAGRGGSRWPALTDWLVARPPVCVALASGILALELGAALVWLRPRLVPAFVAAAGLMHAGTWLVLGLDYWAHLATVTLVLVPWTRMRRP